MPSFSLPSLMTREYSSIRSDSSTAFGSLSIGACVCEGAITGRRDLSEKLGSLVPILTEFDTSTTTPSCWQPIARRMDCLHYRSPGGKLYAVPSNHRG